MNVVPYWLLVPRVHNRTVLQ